MESKVSCEQVYLKITLDKIKHGLCIMRFFLRWWCVFFWAIHSCEKKENLNQPSTTITIAFISFLPLNLTLTLPFS